MSSFNVKQGGVNSRPDSRRVPEWVQTDGSGFSLCAAPLELSGPGFCGVSQRLGERAEVQRCARPEMAERVGSESVRSIRVRKSVKWIVAGGEEWERCGWIGAG